jgi:hypothetical protein
LEAQLEPEQNLQLLKRLKAIPFFFQNFRYI